MRKIYRQCTGSTPLSTGIPLFFLHDSIMANVLSIPLRYDVDLCVLGGSSAAVAAAGAAARQGRSTLLLCDRPYLGEDITATLHFPRGESMTTDLGRQLFGETALERPTPRHLKATLDEHLLATGTPFLYGCHPAAALRDPDGRIAGVLVANRTGFFAVRAKLIIDATWTGHFSRACGLPFTDFHGGNVRVEKAVVSRVANPGENVKTDPEPLEISFRENENIQAFIHRYQFDLSLADSTIDSWMQLELEARRRAWNPEILYSADSIRALPPCGLAREQAVSEWNDRSNLETLATQDPALWLLTPAAGFTPAVAEAFVSTSSFLATGERLGRHLAQLAPQRSAGKLTEIHHQAADQVTRGRLRSEPSATFSRQHDTLPMLEFAWDNVPQFDQVEVLVMGGGTAGASAGISAAMAGARTLLCEYQPLLGGVGTAGMISGYYFGNKTGFTSRIDTAVAEMGPKELQKSHWNTEWKSHYYHETYHQAGGRLWFGAIGCGALLDGDRVRGALIATPHGFGLVECETVIDASGNSDLAAHAGAACEWINSEHVGVQGAGQGPRIPGKFYGNTDWTFSDDCDIEDATHHLALARHKFRGIFDTQPIVNTRERRRIKGDLTLSPLDFLAQRTFPDTIVRARSNFDTHGFTVHPLFMVKPPDKKPLEADVPFRCLLPRGLSGILVTGLGKSAHRDAMPVIRMQADVQNEGYAAGLAAAMVCQENLGGDFRRLEIRTLQRRLIEIGNLQPEVLEQEDSFPLPDQAIAEAVAGSTDSYLALAMIFAEPDRALPALQAKWQKLTSSAEEAADPEETRRIALTLGLLGNPQSADWLAERIAAQTWDDGWNFRGMGQFGASLSPLDVEIVALARTGERHHAPVILEKIGQLTDEAAMSHSRALAMAIESLRCEEAAPALAALLQRPGWSGHAHLDSRAVRDQVSANPNENGDRNLSLRELHLARALYRVGDHARLGARILGEYARDLRGIYSRHARAVLAEQVGNLQAAS